MLVIGITGGTGAGKTTALRAVERLGGVVIDCDALYHGLLKTDEALLREIEAAFPGVVEGGVLQRKKLGEIVFGDGEKLEKLDAITHDHVVRAVQARLGQAEREGCPLAAVDAIALVESGLGALCSVTVAVTAPEEARVRRLIAREGISEDYARKRIGAQQTQDWFRAHCDLTLDNTGSQEEFETECLRRFSALLEEE